MHYVPESACEFLPDDPVRGDDADSAGFHYRSAPIYLLALVVGLLLAADLGIGWIGDSALEPYSRLFGFRLALIAAVLGGARILYQTLERLFEGRIGADLALTIAALAAIVLGEHQTAALVVFIALCGESIEGYTVDRAQRAIRGVFNLCPPVAHLVRDDSEVDVPLEELHAGDVVAVRPGERIPVDGSIESGVSAVDQSALTGESLPIDKSPGEPVYAGTLNRFGALTVRVEKLGEETTLGKALALVAEATKHKAPLERTADRLARLFLPVVLTAAAFTLAGWRYYAGDWSAGFKPALGVLVVACPCALILATPTAVMAAMAWLARAGVVVKGSAALERLATVDTFVFDKTGTLTRGRPVVGSVVTLPPLDETELIRTVAVAERPSEHPLARTIVREAERRGCVVPAVNEFTAHPGGGVVVSVRASVLGAWVADVAPSQQNLEPHERLCRVVVGNRALLASQGLLIPPELDERIANVEESGQTILIAAVENRVLGAIGVRDAVRDESRSVVEELRAEGVERFALLTGDRPETAQAVAESLGRLDVVESEMLPADKARWIEEQTKQGRRVAMVGDGVNDAPALATATVGLALGGVGGNIAAEAGDLVLMGDPLRPLPSLLRLSRSLVANIRQSIWLFAFGMNALGMLLCAVGLFSPAAGAVFHEASSLAVMINAMRLLWFERRGTTRLGRLSERAADAAEWMTQSFSPARIVFGVIGNRAVLAKLALAAAAAYWFATNLVFLDGDEQALVTRFGRFEAQLGPGVHWRWPIPLERVRREPVDRIRTVQIGFRSSGDDSEGEAFAQSSIEWTSAHSDAHYEPQPQEALVLTGDEQPVELTAEVHYRIADLYDYIYGSGRPADVVRATAESAIRETAASSSLDGVLTFDRGRIEQRCLELVRERASRYGLGVEVTDLSLLDVHPPRSVVPAYRDVADALEEQEQSINEAEAYYAARLLTAAGGDAAAILKAAFEDDDQAGQGRGPLDQGRVTRDKGPVASDKGNATSMGDRQTHRRMTDELWKELTTTDGRGEMKLSGEAASELLAARRDKTKTVQSAAGAASRFQSLLKVYKNNPGLTENQLYWSTMEETLSKRPLTIVDPEAAGRRHLFLADPFSLGAGAMFPQPLGNDHDERGQTDEAGRTEFRVRSTE